MKKTYIVLMILVVVLLSACKNTEISGNSEDNAVDNAFSDEATKSSGNIELLPSCLGVSVERYRLMCSAVASGNPEMCNQIKESKDTEQTYQRAICFTLTAIAQKDDSICDKYTTVVSSGGSFIDTECRMKSAIATLDAKECAKLDTENEKEGCIYDINFRTGKTKISDCIDSDCIFNYAWLHDDEKACEQFLETDSSKFATSFRTACLAMLSGNVKDCDSLKSVGVDEWYFCKTKALYKKVMPSSGTYNFDMCGDNEDCLLLSIEDMAYYISSN